MRSKLTYGLLVAFLVFLITANPSGTGESGRDFLAWLSGGWDDTREFVSSLIGEEDGDGAETNDLGEVVIPTVAPESQPTVAPTAPTATDPPPEPAVPAADAAGDPAAPVDPNVVE